MAGQVPPNRNDQNTNIPVGVMDIDDDNHVQIAGIGQQHIGSSVGQMGMSSGFFVPPCLIAQGPHDTTSPGNVGRALQFGVAATQPALPPPPPPPLPPLPPPPPTPASVATVAFPLPPPVAAVTVPVTAAANPTPSAVPFPVQPNVAAPSGYDLAIAAGDTGVLVSATAGQSQVNQGLPPRTTPGQLLSHSARFLQSQPRTQIQHMYSLPPVMPKNKIVSFSDDYGINHELSVNDAIWNHVRALIENTDPSVCTPVFKFGINHQPSMASLQSGGGDRISQSSYGSTASQSSTTQQNIPSLDPVAAIRQQCQLLIQMGRTQDVAQLTHEMNMAAQGQQSFMHFPDQVSYAKMNGQDSEEPEGEFCQNGDISLFGTNMIVNGKELAETYSVEIQNNQNLKKPKSGVLRKFNLMLRRMFPSKL